MVSTVYIENEVASHPRTTMILNRFPKAEIVECERYSQVFNPKAQNFRLQKQNPSLILAKKHKGLILPTPVGYGVGGDPNYYFSHMLNCVYDCRYCFLQGMYSSAHYVVFVNYEDFADEIAQYAIKHESQSPWFFSGYDCDSLAFEPVTGFMAFCLDVFEQIPWAFLEIRTKSTQARSLLNRQPLENVVVAFSFTPDDFSKRFEHGVPIIDKRLNVMQQLQLHGWKLGLRFDPMITYQGYEQGYRQLFERIFSKIPAESIHSVSMGGFRMPKDFYKKIKKLYPHEPLYNLAVEDVNGMKCLSLDAEQDMFEYCKKQILNWLPEDKLYYCDI